MPELDQTAAYTPLTDAQENKVYDPSEPWSDSFALKVALQDFQKAENYRQQNCDWRWRTANELYQAWTQQKYWEGTKVPRASMGVYVALQQVESMLDKIMQMIFSDNPWFQADGMGNTTPQEAAKWRAVVEDQLDQTRVREIYRRVIKSALLFGNGIMKLSWIYKQCKYLEWLPKMRINQGKVERIFDKRTLTKIDNRPELSWVAIEDFYIDPNCYSPQVADAQYVAERKLVTVEDIESFHGQKPFKIPSTMELLRMAKYKPP